MGWYQIAHIPYSKVLKKNAKTQNAKTDIYAKTVFLGGGIQRSLLARPSPFPSALNQRGDSWPPLPRVELIQKVSTNPAWRLVAPSSPCRINTKRKHQSKGILGGSVVGCPLKGRGKTWPMEGHYRVPSLFSKRSNQALRPGPPPKPLSN